MPGDDAQPLADQPVGRVLAAIAAACPAPGAGAAGALALALGLACARKAVAISLTHGEDAHLAEADRRLAALAEAAVAGADLDAEQFAELIAALRLPHREPGEERMRAAELAARRADLAGLASALIALAEEAEQVLARIEGRIHPTMAGDIAAARALAAAHTAIQTSNLAEAQAAGGAGAHPRG